MTFDEKLNELSRDAAFTRVDSPADSQPAKMPSDGDSRSVACNAQMEKNVFTFFIFLIKKHF
jgi:hypothetical protein